MNETRLARFVRLSLWTALFTLVAVDPVAAQNLQPINNVTERFQTFLDGEFAVTVATIALIIAGFLWWTGRIPLVAAAGVLGGIALVFGAPQIIDVFVGVAR